MFLVFFTYIFILYRFCLNQTVFAILLMFVYSTLYTIKTHKLSSLRLQNNIMTGKRIHTSPAGSPSSGNVSDNSKDQERLLPIANVGRIMKKSLPANAKISKEAKETVQECVTEFISFITGEASDKCQREKRKTINGEDLLWAMTTLGFQNYVGSLKSYLNKYVATTDSPSDTGIATTGTTCENSCEVFNWTPKQLSSDVSDNMYHEHVVGYHDELINMVKLHDANTVVATHAQEFV